MPCLYSLCRRARPLHDCIHTPRSNIHRHCRIRSDSLIRRSLHTSRHCRASDRAATRYPIQSTADLRSAYLSFFQRHDHLILPSASLLPSNDPSLLFTSAGMVPLKPYYLSLAQPPHPRLTSSQLCLRAGGKHNDLSEVGHTTRHHTLFEMLGNFTLAGSGSVGRGVKEEAVWLAWRYVREVLGIEEERLRITYYVDDPDTWRLWQSVTGWSTEQCDRQLVAMGAVDNYWAMGDVGPCGPCTELYVDMGPLAPERWLEVWNIVFMQHQRIDAATTVQLDRVCVDTGMGLERMASVMQGVGSNYDIDLFQPIVRTAADIILTSAGSAASSSSSSTSSSRLSSAAASLLKQPPSVASLDFLRDWSFTKGQHLPLSASFTVLLDHIRAISFLYLHGLLPSPTSRGYVLRRLLRRSLTHAYSLGLHQPFLYRLYPAVREAMDGQYPELAKREAEICALIRQEEQLFYATMEKGLHVLAEEMKRVERKGGQKHISGAVAFQLYDAYGFPADLTAMIAEREGWLVDEARFDVLMAEQREGGRRGWVGSGEDAVADDVRRWSSNGVSNQFSGYERMEQDVEVRAVGRAGDDGTYVVIDPCPFYATGGGQVSDSGWLRRKPVPNDARPTAADDEQWEVLECTRVNDNLSVLRIASSSSSSTLLSSTSLPSPASSISSLQSGDIVVATVSPNRSNTAVHHTTTHLLHAALRQHLPTTSGRPVQQAGSLVTPTYFRFDFSYPSSIPHSLLSAIEHSVNELALQRLPVTASVMPKAEAEAAGAVALFSDKYGEDVRVVRVSGASVELCGGTHARNSGECWPFVLLSEGSVSAGIRRIEGVSGQRAVEVMREGWDGLRRMAGGGMKVNVSEVEKQYSRLSAENEQQRQTIKELNKRLVGKKGWPLLNGSLVSAPHVDVRLHVVPTSDGGSLAAMRADAVALSSGLTGVDVLLCEDSGLCMVMADKTRCGVSASDVWQRLMAGVRGTGGRGGGSGGMAQGKLPTDAAGRVEASTVWAVLSEKTFERVDDRAELRERGVMN